MDEKELKKKAAETARAKLSRIIRLYGDAGGKRLEPSYLEQLETEAELQLKLGACTKALMDVRHGKSPSYGIG